MQNSGHAFIKQLNVIDWHEKEWHTWQKLLAETSITTWLEKFIL